jgi:tetratricopeptide (TPR) repeat protein
MAKKEGKEHPTVFISYSHKDKDWVRNWLVPKLEASGIQTHIDYRDFEIGLPSVVNMERAVEQCEKTILVLTPHWVESEWTQFEGIMLQTMDPIGVRKKILPLMLEHCVLPPRLKIFTYADFRDKNNWDFEIEKLIKQIKKDFAQVKRPAVKFPTLAEENVDIARLPKTGYELFGRQDELKLLDEAWELDKTNVLSFVAYGGTGKSTLVNKWLERMRWDNYRGAERVYGWSFYSQGTGERATSADIFINEALKWFGDTNPAEGSEWEKGKRLARLVREKKTLLILDGMEPLQSDVDFDKGKIKDNALAMLVTELAKENNGLCVITTREDIPELARYAQTVKVVNLDQISDEAGRELLKVRGIQGTDEQLEQATQNFGNHALAINLLASYLHGITGHHISNAAKIADIDVPVEKGRHPRRVMEAFDKRFGKGVKAEILRIMGLFDRPAEIAAIDAVRTEPAIAGLTEYLQGIKETEWNKLLEELRDCKLLAQRSKHNPDVVDCHPLVREHFGEKLKNERIEAWREAHGRLYEYYKGLPEKLYGKNLPDTIEEMEPLFRAVYHGCAAGEPTKVWEELYWERICRGNKFYSTRQLGAFGSDLGAVACFFERVWDRPAAGLSEHRKALVLNLAGFALRAVGRLREAAEPMEAGLEIRVRDSNWGNAARVASNLSELYLTSGEAEKVVEYGHRCVEYADKSGDKFWKMGARTTLADALYQAGETGEAKGLFEEAEQMQKEDQPEYPYLYSLQGYKYCDLLISIGEYEEVERRARQTLEWAQQVGAQLLTFALDKLSLGRAELEKVKSKKVKWKNDEQCLIEAKKWMDEAVDGLRKAGEQRYLPCGLLARAGYYRCQQDWDRAWGDLEEAREIAERGEMKLHLADYHLESARLCIDEGRKGDAKGHCKEARRLVEECGYHRRDKELKDIEGRM